MNNPHFPDYSSTMRHLDARGIMRINPSQENILRALKKIELLRPQYKIIQVVGTNGKGSTSSMLASLCTTHGYKTGLFTSPHFISPRERIKINGQIISEEAWTYHANQIMQFDGNNLSYFEFITVLALSFFKKEGVSCAIMEAGLGGTWDATSTIASDLTLITPIALDHCSILGNTIEEITKDKSGAIRENIPVCSAIQEKEAWDIIVDKAEKKKAPIYSSMEQKLPKNIENGSVPMFLSANFQKENAKLAVLGWNTLSKNLYSAEKSKRSTNYRINSSSPQSLTQELLNIQIQRDSLTNIDKPVHVSDKKPLCICGKETSICIAKGLSKAWIPGRLQHVPAQLKNICSFAPYGWPALILDGAHNEHGMKALGVSLAESDITPLAVIFACLEDKNPERIYPHLRALSPGAIFIPPIHDNPRAMHPKMIAKEVGTNAIPTSSIQEALTLAFSYMQKYMPKVFLKNTMEHPLLICGSLYLLGEVYQLRPELLEPPQ